MTTAGSVRESAESVKQVRYDNSYTLDAESHGKETIFRQDKVKAVIGELLRERLNGTAYDPITGTQTAKALANELRPRIQLLGYGRHKLVIQVTLCQQKGQAMRAASHCLWDPTNDGSAWEHFQNDTLTCICQVFGLYFE